MPWHETLPDAVPVEVRTNTPTYHKHIVKHNINITYRYRYRIVKHIVRRLTHKNTVNGMLKYHVWNSFTNPLQIEKKSNSTRIIALSFDVLLTLLVWRTE